jgi:hypothetical protein
VACSVAGSVVLVFHARSYDVMLRDKDRGAPIGDMVAWMHEPTEPLRSGADGAPEAWLAGQR